MRSIGRWAVAAILAAGIACGRSELVPPVSTGSGGSSADGGTDPGGGQDAGAGQDAGTGSGGAGDAGSPGDTGAGTLQAIDFPTGNPDWQFFGPRSGGPQDVYDAAFDEGGNLWVAGGAEGLFLMRADGNGKLSGRFEKLGIAEGLHPYGWLNGEAARGLGVPDGAPADKSPSLAATPVISVAGGPAGTVFVGYQGKPGCEDAWRGDQWTPAAQWGDPAVYKSGDADRVTLSGGGISVVHYDIFSGPGVVAGEVKGREKICSVYRIAWDKAANRVWFGGNHGFAVGVANAPNTPTCNGEYPGATNPGNCAVVWEHSHPAISGCALDTFPSCTRPLWLTDAYYGVAVDPNNHDVWMGGVNRTTKFHFGSYGGNLGAYYFAADDTEWPAGRPCPHSMACGMANRWDLWPDQIPEWDPARGINYVTPAQRSTPGAGKPDYALDDSVSGIVANLDGSAWIASFSHGLVHVDSTGARLADVTNALMTKFVSALARDPLDGSLWAGMAWGGGITRIDVARGGRTTNYSFGPPNDASATFGEKLGYAPVASVQGGGAGSSRRMVVGFHKSSWKDPSTQKVTAYAGAVAIYRGP